MIEPLPPELAKLIAAEHAAPAAGSAVRAIIRAKVAASVAGAPLGAAAGAGAFGVGKILAIIAVVVGAGTIAIVKQTSAPAPSRSHVTATTPPPIATPVATPEPPPPPPPPIEETPKPRKVSPAPPKPPSQAELLQEAWSSLAKGDAQHAFELAAKDARLHPDGALAEEREALHVVALAKLGRATEAAAASSTFLTKYPGSIHRDVVARAISGATQ